MKKPIFLITLIVFMLCAFINVSAQQLYYNDSYHNYEGGVIGLKVNGRQIQNLPMSPVIIDDYTMVPVREVFEALGSEVIWHDDTCQVEIKDNGISVLVKIGDRNTYINNELVLIDEAYPLPMLIGKDETVLKSMVPVRFVAEKLGFKVDWDNDSRTVLIYEDESDISEIIGETTSPDEEITMPEEEGSFGSVKIKSDEQYDYVYISTRYGISPKVTRYQNPERIVFDFPEAAFMGLGNTLTLDGNCVSTVRYSNHENMARLVLDITESTQAFVMSSEQGILIRAEKSENEQIVYDAFAQRVYFDKNYVGNGKTVENGYSVAFTNLKLKDQKIEIHDGVIYEIIIKSTDTGCTVTVDGSNKLTYTAEKGFYKSDNPVKEEEQKPVVNEGKLSIVIDAGHGGDDPGAIGYNSAGKAVAYESHINLAIALLVGEKLENSGMNVIYTRDTDDYITLAGRSDLANSSESDLFVSIHCNSIESAAINGTQVYYHPASETGTVLAENIYNNIVEMTGLSPKKTQNGSHLYVIRTTTCPAVLVETAFISNESDRKYLLSEEGQETMAEAIYQGVMETLEDV